MAQNLKQEEYLIHVPWILPARCNHWVSGQQQIMKYNHDLEEMPNQRFPDLSM